MSTYMQAQDRISNKPMTWAFQIDGICNCKNLDEQILHPEIYKRLTYAGSHKSEAIRQRHRSNTPFSAYTLSPVDWTRKPA